MSSTVPRRALSLAALSVLLWGLALVTVGRAAPLEASAFRVAVAPVAEGRALAYPDSLPLRVENPWWTLTAQPRNVPELVWREMEKALASVEGLEVVHAPELGTYPPPEVVRQVASEKNIDAVLVAAVAVGYGQMEAMRFERRGYMGRVQIQVDVLSGRTARTLSPTLVLEGDDDIKVDFRNRFDYYTLHHLGAGPEVRERIRWSVKEIGDQLKEKLSAAWLGAALADEGRAAASNDTARVAITQVDLEPTEPTVGRSARMIVSYKISGLAAGEVASVTETRRLVREGRLVAGPFETVHSLGNGSHTSSQELQVPAEAEAGLYTIQATVEAAGARDEGSGTFSILGSR